MKAYTKDYVKTIRNVCFFVCLIVVSFIWLEYTGTLFDASDNLDIINFILLVRIVFFFALGLLGGQYIYRWWGEQKLCKHIQCSLFDKARNKVFLVEGIMLILLAIILIILQIKNVLIYL